jgi:hypothetical protein
MGRRFSLESCARATKFQRGDRDCLSQCVRRTTSGPSDQGAPRYEGVKTCTWRLFSRPICTI